MEIRLKKHILVRFENDPEVKILFMLVRLYEKDNDPAVMEIAKAAGREIVGDELVSDYPQIMAGDDFGAYSDYAPSAYFFLGGGGHGPGHNGSFCLEDGMLPVGSAIHASFALKALRG